MPNEKKPPEETIDRYRLRHWFMILAKVVNLRKDHRYTRVRLTTVSIW